MPNQVINIGLLLLLTIIKTSTFACQVKYFPNSESFVCICNETNCDSINPQPNSLPDHITVYRTDKSSDRLAKSVIHVNDLSVESSNFDITVRINSTDRRQTILGFGGAFTDSTGINVNKLPTSLIDKLIENYFSCSDGLGYTFGRVPIAGADFSLHGYTYDDVEDDFDLKHFALTEWDFNYKIPLIKKAMNVSCGLKLFSAPWTAPKWLKTNNNYTGLGILKGEPESKYWKTWTNYLIKFLDSYKQHGIQFWALSAQNEPSHGLIPEWGVPNVGFSGSMMREFIKKDLGPALRDSGYTKDQLKMLIWDDELLDIMSFVDPIMTDEEAAAYVSGVAFHWYNQKYYETLDLIHSRYPQVFLLSTEASVGVYESVSFGNWTRAELLAADIIEGLNRWSTGWVDWNLVLDEVGGPNWIGNFVDAMILVNDTTPEYYKQPIYYVFGHFSRLLRPGSINVGHSIVTGQSEESNVKVTAFLSPTNDLIVTILNLKDSLVNLSIEGLTSKPFTMTVKGRSITSVIKSPN